MNKDSTGGKKIEEIKAELGDLTEIMKRNMDLVVERGEKIEELLPKTEKLNATSARFNRGARDLNNNGCCSCFASFWNSVTDGIEDAYSSLTSSSAKNSDYGSINHTVK